MSSLLTSLLLSYLAENRVPPSQDMADRIKNATKSIAAFLVLAVSLAFFVVVEIGKWIDRGAIQVAPWVGLDPDVAEFIAQALVVLVAGVSLWLCLRRKSVAVIADQIDTGELGPARSFFEGFIVGMKDKRRPRPLSVVP